MTGALLLLAALAGADDVDTAFARVVYLSGTTVYLDAGRDRGLREGMPVQALRGGHVVATLTVTHLSSQRAACVLSDASHPVAVGDTVRFVPVVLAGPVAGETDARSRSRGRAGPRTRGRIGLRYLATRPADGAPGVTQPAADLRLEAPRLGGTPLGITTDVRTRMTYRQNADGSQRRDARTAVYQASTDFRSADGHLRIGLGRQYLPSVSSVSLFDGLLLAVQGRQVGGGVFAGSEPEAGGMGYSREIMSYGAFAEVRSPAGQRTRWRLTGGGVGSYRDGDVNREYGFVQASVATPGVNLLVTQEVDLNRGWKREAGEPALTFTSTFATLSLRPAPWVDLYAGMDNRRTVRLYRDREDPETAFDDRFRQGLWGGLTLRPRSHLRLGLDGRASRGGSDSAARPHSVTAHLAVDRVTPLLLGLTGRATRFRSAQLQGWLQSATLRARPRPWLGLEGTLGRRADADSTGRTTRTTRWVGLDLDLMFGRGVYVLLSASRDRGDGGAGDLLHTGLSFRF